MKLLFYIFTLRGGGAERVLSSIVNGLVDRGYEVHLAVDTRQPIEYTIDERVIIHSFFDADYVANNRIVYHWKFHKNLRNIATSVQPDVIISFMWGLNIHTLISTLGLSIPFICSEHFTFKKEKMSLYEYFIRFHMNCLANRVTILTQADYDFLGKRLKNKVVVPNPLSFPIIKKKVEKRDVILAAGSLDRWEHKGFDNLIKIWAGIALKYPSWTLEIAGAGSEANLAYLKELTTEHKVESKVKFIGFCSDIDKKMQESSIFILPSRREGFGMVLLEAMSQGSACISFDCNSGPREIISDGIDGILVEDQNLNEMKIALSNLIENKSLREKLAKNGLVKADQFSLDKILDKWESVFKEVIKK